jgi:hypothetical protein
MHVLLQRRGVRFVLRSDIEMGFSIPAEPTPSSMHDVPADRRLWVSAMVVLGP